MTIQARIRFTRCRCGCARTAGWPSCWRTRRRPETPGRRAAALIAQAADAVARVTAAGLLPAGARVAEYGSPHGGSWLDMLRDQGLKPAGDGDEADVIVDCFGLMHAADQAAALAERAARLAPGGVLLLQFHSIETILRTGQWNALRHGHFAYYSATALVAMLHSLKATTGAVLSPRTSWLFDLYGGTVLLAVQRDGEGREADEAIAALLAGEQHAGVTDPGVLPQPAARCAGAGPSALNAWLTRMRQSGK